MEAKHLRQGTTFSPCLPVSLSPFLALSVAARLLVSLSPCLLLLAGCLNTPVDTSDYVQGPAPRRIPSPAKASCCYEDSLTGGEIFAMYCYYCHNAPPLAERPFSNFKNVAAHMRVRANLTGKEYAKLMEFLRRWHDIPPPEGPLDPSPKRFIFSQPITELRKQPPPKQAASFDPPGQPAAQPAAEPAPVAGIPADGNGAPYLFQTPTNPPGFQTPSSIPGNSK